MNMFVGWLNKLVDHLPNILSGALIICAGVIFGNLAYQVISSTTLDRAINADGWSDSDVLPVIDREEKLVGVLRFADLREALNRPSLDVHASTDSNNLVNITEICCLRLADLIVTTLAKEKEQV